MAPSRPAPRPSARGVTVVLDLPDASAGDLFDVADTLHSLALDLVPGASAHTEVHLGDPEATSRRLTTAPAPTGGAP